MQVRNINGALDELKKSDPKTAVTRRMLSQAVESGQIPHFKLSKRIYVTMENVYEFLSGERVTPQNDCVDKHNLVFDLSKTKGRGA